MLLLSSLSQVHSSAVKLLSQEHVISDVRISTKKNSSFGESTRLSFFPPLVPLFDSFSWIYHTKTMRHSLLSLLKFAFFPHFRPFIRTLFVFLRLGRAFNGLSCVGLWFTECTSPHFLLVLV